MFSNVGIEAILDSRPADMVRELEGIYRAKYWTIDQLIERSEDWDTGVFGFACSKRSASGGTETVG